MLPDKHLRLWIFQIHPDLLIMKKTSLRKEVNKKQEENTRQQILL